MAEVARLNLYCAYLATDMLLFIYEARLSLDSHSERTVLDELVPLLGLLTDLAQLRLPILFK